MERVLFSHSYFMRFDPKQWATGQPYAPLATIGAAALLRRHGFAVSLFDTMFVESPDQVIQSLSTERPDFFVVYDDGFNYLTKMCLTNMREAAFRMIQLARRQGCIVIVSSSDSTDHYQEYLEKGADFILLGEGEQTLLELVTTISAGRDDFPKTAGRDDFPGTVGREDFPKTAGREDFPKTAGRDDFPKTAGRDDFSQIAGLAWLQNKLPVRNAARKVMKDLDSLPLPAWDLVDVESYRQVWMNQHGYFSLNVSTTRGCPFKCNWCAKPIYGNRYNARSPQHVVEEIKMLKTIYGFDHIWMCDDIFGLKPNWVEEFADLIEDEGLQFRFKIQSRADLLLQENYVRALARAGCDNSWMGAESGSQKILDAMDKGTTVEQIAEATALLREHGIHPGFFIQFGYPGETKEDIELTIRMINHLLPDEIGISVSYPLPGTVFYERVKSQLKEKTNWTDSDELRLMFRNTYPPAFYKQLHRYVHRSYRWHFAFRQLTQSLARPAQFIQHGFRVAATIGWNWMAATVAKQKLKRLETL